ncbi:hypothetical protein [Clostridium rectalis]|uniref:hypothetical protein n=1 Tax=Clostridium rectalis TaxID=2040295 RepID=UPI000F632002|nr:hypothetical protein [Clostridium rectalis]
MEFAGESYKKQDCMTIMKHSQNTNKFLNEFTSKYKRQIGEPNIQYENNQYFYVEFDKESCFNCKDLILSEEEVKSKHPYQYYNIQYEEMLKDSNNWVFDEYITKKMIKNRNEIFKGICKVFMRIG